MVDSEFTLGPRPLWIRVSVLLPVHVSRIRLHIVLRFGCAVSLWLIILDLVHPLLVVKVFVCWLGVSSLGVVAAKGESCDSRAVVLLAVVGVRVVLVQARVLLLVALALLSVVVLVSGLIGGHSLFLLCGVSMLPFP